MHLGLREKSLYEVHVTIYGLKDFNINQYGVIMEALKHEFCVETLEVVPTHQSNRDQT